jgi:hypothetical protein
VGWDIRDIRGQGLPKYWAGIREIMERGIRALVQGREQRNHEDHGQAGEGRTLFVSK